MRQPLAGSTLKLNERAAALADAMERDAEALRIAVRRVHGGVRLIDAGIEAIGSTEAGLRVAEVCMGGYGRVRLRQDPDAGRQGGWPTWIEVASSQPVLACLASQYAGWSLAASKEETGGKKFFALGSGPARALAAKEALYEELGWREQGAAAGVLVLEVDREPPAIVLDKVLAACGLKPEQLTVILTPTASPAGTTQVVARVLEVALHKAHETAKATGFDLADLVDGRATAPLPAVHPDGVEAMGRTNDAILYGGSVHLDVRGPAEAAARLAATLPAGAARGYGQPFAAIFRDAGFDFYKIDGALFAPAEIWVSHLPSGATHQAGELRLDVLRNAWLNT